MKRFGKDYVSIAKHVRTKDRVQVSNKIRISLEHKGFPKIKLAKPSELWTDSEKETYVKIIKKHG